MDEKLTHIIHPLTPKDQRSHQHPCGGQWQEQRRYGL